MGVPNMVGRTACPAERFCRPNLHARLRLQVSKGKPFPDQLLKGRTARMITTMDGPSWYFKWFQGEPAHKMMKISTFGLTGIKPVRITTVDQVGKKSDEQRKNWLDKIEQLGRKMG